MENRVTCLIPEGPLAAVLQESGVEVDSLRMRRGVPGPSAVGRLASRIRAFRPDVVQTWLYHADLLGTLAARFGAGGVPLAWNIRCAHMDLASYSPATRWTRSALARLSRLPGGPSVIVANSGEAARYHRELGYSDRFRIIPNGIDPEKFKPDPSAKTELCKELRIPADTPLVGMVARLDPMKDHESFLRAAEIILRERPKVRFLLAGDGMRPETPELHRLLTATRTAHAVYPLGRRNDVPRISAAMDVACLASHGESFPNVLAEAMACGTSVAASDVGGVKDILDGAGRTVPPGDPAGLAEAVMNLLDAPENPQALHDSIAARYSLGATVRAYELMYEGLLKGRAHKDSKTPAVL